MSIAVATHTLSLEDLGDIAGLYADDTKSWLPQVRFELRGRSRVQIASEFGYEVWLTTWLPGQSSEVHAHDGASGALTVVRGSLVESTYSEGRRPREQVLGLLDLRLFGPRHVHRLCNRNRLPAVAIGVRSSTT